MRWAALLAQNAQRPHGTEKQPATKHLFLCQTPRARAQAKRAATEAVMVCLPDPDHSCAGCRHSSGLYRVWPAACQRSDHGLCSARPHKNGHGRRCRQRGPSTADPDHSCAGGSSRPTAAPDGGASVQPHFAGAMPGLQTSGLCGHQGWIEEILTIFVPAAARDCGSASGSSWARPDTQAVSPAGHAGLSHKDGQDRPDAGCAAGPKNPDRSCDGLGARGLARILTILVPTAAASPR